MIGQTHNERQAGLTLVELMVTILLAGILTAGLFYMTTGQTRTYRSQLHQMTAQERAWGALEYLARQVRMAGFGFAGCPAGEILKADGGGSTIASDLVALQVFNDCSLYDYTGSWPPASGTCNGHGVDSLAVSYSRASAVGGLVSVRLDHQMANKNSDLKVTSCIGFAVNDLVALWDPGEPSKPCTLLQVTSLDITGKGDCKIRHATGTGPYNDVPFPSGGYPRGGLAINMGAVEQPIKFAIDRTGPAPRLVQWQNSKNPTDSDYDLEVIADGIEDMQISWACDRSATSASVPAVVVETPGVDTDDWAHNIAGETAVICGTNTDTSAPNPVAAVRITLIARGMSAEPGFNTGFRPAAEDRAEGPKTGAGSDKDISGGTGTFTRAVLTTTIKPRNLREGP